MGAVFKPKDLKKFKKKISSESLKDISPNADNNSAT